VTHQGDVFIVIGLDWNDTKGHAIIINNNNNNKINNSKIINNIMMLLATAVAAVGVATILFPQSPLYLGFFFSAQHRSETMRAPGNGLSGWVARRLMTKVNQQTSAHVVRNFLNVQKGDLVIELGPGSGHALPAIFSSEPDTVIGIEISPSFRNELSTKFASEMQSKTLVVSGDDAIQYLTKHVADGSVNRILGSNVVYFLNPLDRYLTEFYRVLQPGGTLVFAVKDMVKKQAVSTAAGPSAFVNTDWDACLVAMEQAGFRAERKPLQLEQEGPAKYWPLVGTKN